MKRIPFGYAVAFNIVLLLAALNGMLSTGGIFILIINSILTLPALLRYIYYVIEKRQLKKELKRKQKDLESEKAKVVIGALIHIISSEEETFYVRITALVTLNDLFVTRKNRNYICGLKDNNGNLINEYTMRLFIANYSEHLMTHPQATNDLKELLEKLSYNSEEFASKRLEPMLKRTLQNIKKQNETI